MDEEIRHIDSLPWPAPSFTSLTPHWTSLYLSHPLVCQSTLTKCSGKSALLSPFLFHLPPLSPLLLLLPSFIYLFCVKTKNKRKKTKKNVLCSLLTWKLLFYTKSRLGFLFSNIWMLEVLYWRKKTQNIIIIISIVLQLYIMYSHFLSGTWNKHAEYAFTLFSSFLFFWLSPVWYLHGTGKWLLHAF